MLTVPVVCKACRGSFAPQDSSDDHLCAECLCAREEQDLQKVVRYLEGHPHDTLIDIVCGTGVTMSRVRKLIVNGRLDRRREPRP